MKTAQEVLQELKLDKINSKQVGMMYTEWSTKKAMQEYARQVAEAVRDECIILSTYRAFPEGQISQLDINKFIK